MLRKEKKNFLIANKEIYLDLHSGSKSNLWQKKKILKNQLVIKIGHKLNGKFPFSKVKYILNNFITYKTKKNGKWTNY